MRTREKELEKIIKDYDDKKSELESKKIKLNDESASLESLFIQHKNEKEKFYTLKKQFDVQQEDFFKGRDKIEVDLKQKEQLMQKNQDENEILRKKLLKSQEKLEAEKVTYKSEIENEYQSFEKQLNEFEDRKSVV